MAFEKTTLEVFKRRLKDGEYNDATGARRAVGKAKEMSDAEKKKAYAAIDAHSGPWAGGKGKKTAKKPAAAAKKAAAPAAKKTAKKAAKKPAGKPAEAEAAPKKPAGAKKTARAKRAVKAGARKPKGADKEARPATEPEVTAQAPVLPEVPVLSREDIARNPMAVKNYAIEAIGAFGQAYGIYSSMAKEHPEFPLQAMINELGEGMQKAHSLLGAGVGVVHEAAVRAGVAPGSMMTPTPTVAPAPAAAPEQGVDMATAQKAANAAKKVHGVGDPAPPAVRPS